MVALLKKIFDCFLNKVSLKYRQRILHALLHRLNKSGIEIEPPKHVFPKKDMFLHINLLKGLNFKPTFIFDVGAYSGEWTSKVRRIYPEVQIYMFEAQESKRDKLVKVCQESQPCEYRIALLGSENKDKVVFYEMETGSSMYQENTSYERNIVLKKMQRLDEMVSEIQLEAGGFLKLDVQGAELDILNGALGIVGKTDVILMEVNLLNYNQDAPEFSTIVKELTKFGFSVFDICDEHRTSSGILFQIDVIFLRTNSKIRNEIMFEKA